MKIYGVIRLHYGADYLRWVIKSFRPIAEKVVILYTEMPSFQGGRPSRDGNIDTRADLVACIPEEDKERILWYDNQPVDVYQVPRIFPEVDAVLELDSDEVISPELCGSILHEIDQGTLGDRVYRLPMIHHWRSFNYYCTNQGWPTRMFFPKNTGGNDSYFPGGYERGVIHHFGYCRRRKEMEYKVDLSEHRPEWRPGWWEEKYNRFPEVLEDVHPTCINMWNAQPYDKTKMPDIMRDHPYWDLEVVE